jgi:hypothetical protein
MKTLSDLKPPTSPNAAMWFLFAGFAAYWLLVSVFPVESVRNLFNNLSFGVAFLVLITWAGPAWEAFRKGIKYPSQWLIIAIFLAFAILLYQRTIAIALVWLDSPPWLANGPLIGFIPYSITLVGFLFLFTPGMEKKAPPVHYWKLVLASVGVSALLAGVMIGRSLPPL